MGFLKNISLPAPDELRRLQASLRGLQRRGREGARLSERRSAMTSRLLKRAWGLGG
jgi:hypothetical protein